MYSSDGISGMLCLCKIGCDGHVPVHNIVIHCVFSHLCNGLKLSMGNYIASHQHFTGCPLVSDLMMSCDCYIVIPNDIVSIFRCLYQCVGEFCLA